MVKKIYPTPPAAPETSGPTEFSAKPKFLDATVLQAVRNVLAIFDYLYKVPLVPIAELSTKDICIICKGNTDIRFPICETARSRVRLANCGDILCLGCLSRSAFSSRGDQCPHCQKSLCKTDKKVVVAMMTPLTWCGSWSTRGVSDRKQQKHQLITYSQPPTAQTVTIRGRALYLALIGWPWRVMFLKEAWIESSSEGRSGMRCLAQWPYYVSALRFGGS